MAKTLKDLRLENKKTVAEVAKVLGVTERAFLRYEQGVRLISLRQVLALALLYQESAEEIIEAQINSQQCR